ncbi:hypothetical protein M9Y10_010488 [Tritrichomonas musculus]|uniref:F5/8 type C domain-containing protein n=1 Tax=Tritrichomonas musculus TaxID=1915356 RepID=A0ABR2IMP6_9EUKA
MSFSFELSTKNFKEASKINGNDEFNFIIGEKRFSCHKFVAAFISPRVCKMLLSDPTIDELYISKDNAGKLHGERKIEYYIQSLIKGEQIYISPEDLKKMICEIDTSLKNDDESQLSKTTIYDLINLIEKLDNKELKQEFYTTLFDNIIKDDKSNNSGAQLESLESLFKLQKIINKIDKEKGEKEEEMCNFLSGKYNDIIDSISSRLYEFDIERIKKIDFHILKDLLLSEKLVAESEDSLLDVLLFHHSMRKNGHDNCFEYVRFEYLSTESIENFLNEIEYDEVTPSLFESISKRLILAVEPKTENNRQKTSSNIFKYDKQHEFNGIFKHLTDITNGNIHSNKTIEITCSRLCCGSFDALVDFNNSNGYAHLGSSPSPRWIQIDFKTRNIQLYSYLIKSNDSSGGCRALRSWKVEISEDGQKWQKIDEQNEVNELNGYNKTKLFEVKETAPFHFIRIISDKPNFYNNNGFAIGNIELYGKIFGQ